MKAMFSLPRASFLAAGFLFFSIISAHAEEATAGKEIRVNIDRQILMAMEGDEEVYSFDVAYFRHHSPTIRRRIFLSEISGIIFFFTVNVIIGFEDNPIQL